MSLAWISPLSVACLLILVTALCMQVIFDHKRARAQQDFRRKISGRAGGQHSITVLVELRHRASTIIPLLEHLEAQHYSKLQVIIVVRQTAGTRAVGELQRHRRTHALPLRIVRHRKGMTPQAIVSRYSKSQLVLILGTNHRLSNGFFEDVSVYFRDKKLKSLQPRQLVRPDNRLASAFLVTTAIWLEAIRDAHDTHDATPKEAIVYRRQPILSPPNSLNTRFVSHVYIHRPMPASLPKLTDIVADSYHASRQWLNALGFLLLLLGGLSIAVRPADISLLLFVLVGAYTTVFGTQLNASKGYSVADRASLLLLSPFSMLVLIVVGLSAKLSGLIKVARKIVRLWLLLRPRLASSR